MKQPDNGISRKSLDFLDENHRQNSREWFTEHRDEYDRHVREPMLRLAEYLIPTLAAIDPLLVLDSKRAVCRIHRDTRFSRDKTAFKRASWFVFQRSKGMVHPVWFFEFTPDFHRYGCGYYLAPPKVMDELRRLVQANDKRYREAQSALDALRGFSLEGDRYKRARYPQAPEKQQDWLERKSVTAMHTSTDQQRLFSKKLPGVIKDAFVKLAPVYTFLIHAHESAASVK